MSEEKKEDEPLIVGWDKSEEGTTVVFARSLPDGRIEIVDERRDLSREILEMIDERFRERHPDLSRQVVVFSNPPRGAMSDWLRERFAEPIPPWRTARYGWTGSRSGAIGTCPTSSSAPAQSEPPRP